MHHPHTVEGAAGAPRSHHPPQTGTPPPAAEPFDAETYYCASCGGWYPIDHFA
ncbi:hypothetical protein [Streptomyces youssoufiensis]